MVRRASTLVTSASTQHRALESLQSPEQMHTWATVRRSSTCRPMLTPSMPSSSPSSDATWRKRGRRLVVADFQARIFLLWSRTGDKNRPRCPATTPPDAAPNSRDDSCMFLCPAWAGPMMGGNRHKRCFVGQLRRCMARHGTRFCESTLGRRIADPLQAE